MINILFYSSKYVFKEIQIYNFISKQHIPSTNFSSNNSSAYSVSHIILSFCRTKDFVQVLQTTLLFKTYLHVQCLSYQLHNKHETAIFIADEHAFLHVRIL